MYKKMYFSFLYGQPGKQAYGPRDNKWLPQPLDDYNKNNKTLKSKHKLTLAIRIDNSVQ